MDAQVRLGRNSHRSNARGRLAYPMKCSQNESIWLAMGASLSFIWYLGCRANCARLCSCSCGVSPTSYSREALRCQRSIVETPRVPDLTWSPSILGFPDTSWRVSTKTGCIHPPILSRQREEHSATSFLDAKFPYSEFQGFV